MSKEMLKNLIELVPENEKPSGVTSTERLYGAHPKDVQSNF